MAVIRQTRYLRVRKNDLTKAELMKFLYPLEDDQHIDVIFHNEAGQRGTELSVEFNVTIEE